MSSPRIIFFPDYGAEIGGGHLMRCLTLASALKARGATCGFVALPGAVEVIDTFGAGVEIVSPDWPADIVVLDGYGLTLEDEKRFSDRGLKVAAFDDILRTHACNLVIDSGLGRLESDYPDTPTVLAGPTYAPLRAEFAARREAALARRAEGFGGRVLVSMGLTDLNGITGRIVEALRGYQGWSAMDVVLGSGAQSLPFVEAAATTDPRITLHVDAQNMAELAAAADIAIGAGGMSQWERAAVGLPTILVILAENQASSARQLAEMGAAIALDAEGPLFESLLESSFVRLVEEPETRTAISERAASLCDGDGADRVAEAVLALV